MIKTVTARELQEKISKKNLHLLDVREKVEYAMGHVPSTFKRICIKLPNT